MKHTVQNTPQQAHKEYYNYKSKAMKRKEFKLQVRMLATPEDFQENEKVLNQIEKWELDSYLCCLKLGADMVTAKEMSNIMWGMQVETHLDHYQIVQIMPKFKRINELLDGCITKLNAKS